MSTVQNSLWTKLPAETLDSKYEKCRNITEEIYKRINITFQIKKLETNIQSDLSDNSDQIDSNELSNETDLFACDKSSISSSTEIEALEQGSAACEKFINNNNNEEKVKKATVICKRPRKRFRKRVKKQQPSKKESDGSSDEAIPLSRVAVVDNRAAKSPLHSFMGVPNVVITPIDLKKLKLPIPDTIASKKSEPKQTQKAKGESPKEKIIDKTKVDIKKSTAAHKSADKTIELKKGVEKPETCQTREKSVKEKSPSEWHCTLCSLSFKGERGLRRHMTMSHIISPDEEKKTSKAREET